MSEKHDEIEKQLSKVLARLKANEDAKNGEGAFDHSVRRGMLMMSKRHDQLLPEEKAFLQSPAPKKRH